MPQKKKGRFIMKKIILNKKIRIRNDEKFVFIPMKPFKTYEEEANFWDTHCALENWTEAKIRKTLELENNNIEYKNALRKASGLLSSNKYDFLSTKRKIVSVINKNRKLSDRKY